MKLSRLFEKKPCVFSVECFPPKQATSLESLKDTLRGIKQLNVDYISVTYGAGGSTNSTLSIDIASFIKNELKVEALAHILCMGTNAESMEQTVLELKKNGIENILALRGDKSATREESRDFRHASDLIRFLSQKGDFFLSGACYPEGHPESPTPQSDIDGLLIKQANGAHHFITQLFFDNNKYYRFLNRARKSGITAPISAGVMPIVKSSQIERTVKLSSASMPSDFTKMISLYQNDSESLYKAGIDYAVKQLRDLIEGGADGVHLYAMNSLEVATKVYDGIKDLLE